jgi:hypothetical protein
MQLSFGVTCGFLCSGQGDKGILQVTVQVTAGTPRITKFWPVVWCASSSRHYQKLVAKLAGENFGPEHSHFFHFFTRMWPNPPRNIFPTCSFIWPTASKTLLQRTE